MLDLMWQHLWLNLQELRDATYPMFRHVSRRLTFLYFCVALSATTLTNVPAVAETEASKICEQNGETTRVRLGVRKDAPPFSYEVVNRKTDQGSDPYAGYSVELCTEFVGSTHNKTGLNDYCFVEVDPSNRLLKLDSGEIDLLCGATTASIDVRAENRTSLTTYLSVSGLSYMRKGLFSKNPLGNQDEVRVGVRTGTTSEEDLKKEKLPGAFVTFLDSNGLTDYDKLKLIELDDHNEAPVRLRDGSIHIYFADRPIMEAILADSDGNGDIAVYNLPITLQPYSIIVADRPFGRNDDAGIELQRNFDRYLSNEKFAPSKVDAFIDSLYVLMRGNVEPFFLDIARIQGVFP